MSQNIHYLLWTGGFDSTFRLVELARIGCTVQPLYVESPSRKSRALESSARKNILRVLKNHSLNTFILPVEKIPRENIPENQKITNAFREIRRHHWLGGQYEYLARLLASRPDLKGTELAVEDLWSNTDHFSRLLREICTLKKSGDAFVIDPKKSTPEGRIIFENFRFGIATRTEPEMLNLLESWGFSDVLQNIWFCFHPKKGLPCGLCNPCRVKIESGLASLLPPAAISRYKKFSHLKKKFGLKFAKKLRPLLRLFS
ncbi:hypothetical protein IJG76_00245 [Candidatus Saccharibacteria bacterium]|nr:hypothetical protein [Candidatus Saccharibacteria bacterium]